MDLRKGINSTIFYFVFAILFTFACCIHAASESKHNSTKSVIVQAIIKKVSNLTLGALFKAPQETKERILKKIENKLRKSADAIGPDANKHISFIMEQFKAKISDPVAVKETKIVPDTVEEKPDRLIGRSKPEEGQAGQKIDSATKKEIIKDIANKIQTLAQGFMKRAKTIESKQRILEKIKQRIMDSTKEKHIQLHNKHSELKTYSELIAQGLEVSMRRMLEREASGRRMDTIDSQALPKLDSEVITVEKHKPENSEVLPKIDSEVIKLEKHKPENSTKVEDEILKKTINLMDIQEIDKYRDLVSQSLNSTTNDPHCYKIVEDTCTRIQSFNQISCGGGKVIPAEYLCNNVSDCLNRVDEENCATQAMELARTASKVMSEVEVSVYRKCFIITEDNLLMSQNEVLRDVLKTQMSFLKKHVKTPSQRIQSKDEVLDGKFVQATVNDVTKILSTLSYALDATLCARITTVQHHGNNDFRKFNDIVVDSIEELDEVPKEPGWSPKLCRCKGQFCVEPTCHGVCKRVCWQRYSLNHWGCQALSGANAVSLNVVCDGKLDCFDETDESSCTTDGTSTKFQAAKLYSNLLDLLTAKSKSKVFKSRNKWYALHDLVRSLQKQTVRTHADTHSIKSLRDEAFGMLLSIYDDSLETDSLDELEDHYLTLLAINGKLVTALKASHAGNENLMSAEGCSCRDGLCVLRRCSKYCIQACLAEPLLTKFSCNDVKNLTTPIESICNGIKNCPNEEDEKDCSKDICRGHHLVMLRHNLENIGVKHRNSLMGEVIEDWRVKVSAALIVTETTHRTTHKLIFEIVHKVLQDLVTAFAAMEDYRRSNSEYALQEFKGIAKIVTQTLKSCTH